MAKLTHIGRGGRARMVDVGAKRRTLRRAVAEGRVQFGAAAFAALRENRLSKGDALAVARLAGIQAAKRTAEWIPLCHTVPLEHVEIEIELVPRRREAQVVARAAARWSTGVEMEALVAVAAACLALYDMAKALDRGASLEGLRLVSKSGGRSGTWRR
ncbi:MAG TPA: cyclic pyranopterin monophosphate synthase MoaC [Candidatus Polarisedimenticolaceae bacterium]|nr:cyclic pyranopterin monophosphate synthase MoaC [Candidatus Polarisedimenticolaceae bacterium]